MNTGRLAIPRSLVRRFIELGGALRQRCTDSKGARVLTIAAGASLLVAVGLSVYLLVRPTPRPDYLTARMDRVFNYTLLTDDFNDLPIRERLDLINQLVSRVSSMSKSDSVLMAAFASAIVGRAREQLEKNASKLFLDTWDMFATDYDDTPPEERREFLQSSAVELHKLMDAVDGSISDMSDADRLADMEHQARTERERMTNPRYAPGASEASMMFDVLRNDVGGNATPQQRARVGVFMRDMMRMLRGDN